ncbi:hypothetical protein [Chryseobacterium sp.]|uniref:hypothetical protein n=1 Tax=Chryseobacterium sp. TaxID=1871047 RepID=UPI0025C12067|nr:hypothetical protein [Chryseobacterium sp.]
MKKILLGIAMGLATMSFAQQYPDNNGWGDGSGYSNDYYGNDQYGNNFPDDYYYNYPQDYYPNSYYQSYYNDYRNSIVSINWNVFFRQNRLSNWQINQIIQLNGLYANFSVWNNYYRYNPDRWYYDRYYAMERILGPRLFIVFQNNYYRGSSPVVYFQNYRRTYYAPRYSVMPRYRNVNINIYRVDRNKFSHNNNPTYNIVRNNRPGNNGGFRNNNDSGFRNQSNNGVRNNNNNNQGGFRGSNNNSGNNNVRNNNNSGFRNGTADNSGIRNNGNQGIRREAAPRTNNGNSGFRSENNRTQQRTENSAPRIKNSRENNGNDNRNSGFRQRLANN